MRLGCLGRFCASPTPALQRVLLIVFPAWQCVNSSSAGALCTEGNGTLNGSCTRQCTPASTWADSYSVSGRCYCLFSPHAFDHGIGEVNISIGATNLTVRQVCQAIRARWGEGPTAGRQLYNTVQCGHPPYNDAGDEDFDACPGRVDVPQGGGCRVVGPCWDLDSLNLTDAPTPVSAEVSAAPSTAPGTSQPNSVQTTATPIAATSTPPTTPTASPFGSQEVAVPTVAPTVAAPTVPLGLSTVASTTASPVHGSATTAASSSGGDRRVVAAVVTVVILIVLAVAAGVQLWCRRWRRAREAAILVNPDGSLAALQFPAVVPPLDQAMVNRTFEISKQPSLDGFRPASAYQVKIPEGRRFSSSSSTV
mmetsp:Transcript_28782/g.75522  ORF Transcript_28782/g.75522 Transcript_28782/m.75522 type:complete len:365 (+) Transcript_28782:122-1216(+)